MSNHPTPEEPEDFDAPPPPPGAPSDDEEDMGLATEMMFSGQRRQELRNGFDDDTLRKITAPNYWSLKAKTILGNTSNEGRSIAIQC